MAKSYFTAAKMLEHFEPLVGNVLDYTQEELAAEISDHFFVEFPSADGFPTCFPGQPDYNEIARIMQQERANALLNCVDADALVLLGEEWLALQMEADLTEEWQTNAACDKRMTEIETALPADYLAGLGLGLEWVLKRQLQEAIDDHDHHDLACATITKDEIEQLASLCEKVTRGAQSVIDRYVGGEAKQEESQYLALYRKGLDDALLALIERAEKASEALEKSRD